MNINDFFIPIFVIVVIIAIFIFLKNKSKNVESNKVEGFTDNSLEKHDFSRYQINIGENLFVGFGSKTESDNQIDILQQAKMDFPEKMKNIYPNKNSIVINSDNDNVLGNLCLGSPKYTGDKLIEKLEEHKKSCDDDEENCVYYNSNFLKDNYDRCLNYDTLESFDLTKNEIPYFKDWRGRQVYYNGDQPIVRHNKLCFRDVDDSRDICLEERDIKSINGKNSVKLKMLDGGVKRSLVPYNLEYGYHKGFGGVVSTPHYMLQNQFNSVDTNLRNSGANRGCYTSGYHYATGAGNYSDNYYLIANPRPLSYYTHIHEHEDAE